MGSYIFHPELGNWHKKKFLFYRFCNGKKTLFAIEKIQIEWIALVDPCQ